MHRGRLPLLIGGAAMLLSACQSDCIQNLAARAYTSLDEAIGTLDVEPIDRTRAGARDCADLSVSSETITICSHRDDATRDQAVAELVRDGQAVQRVDVFLTVSGTDRDTVDAVVSDLLRTPGNRC